ncbi:glycosyl hydrolase catalytic core-domain-containing protein [Mycena sp. CBHHK59/15]|nr:glycosyl hydrolase catalytic core-domain-containing protein [Mycena sp. CBHHK59/15]
MVFTPTAILSAVALLAALPTAHATARGLAWATDNNFAPVIGSKPMVTWYHHWQDGPVSQMPSKNEYVPMFWGSKKWDKWNARKAEMAKKTPKHLLAFNEPDIASQGDMSPSYAADVWMKEIQPWAAKGTKLGSPAVAWDLNWTQNFLAELKKRGGHVDFVAVHWYGSYKDIAGFKKFVASAHSRFGYTVWVTELGVTTASKPSKQQTKEFMMQAYAWMDSVGYVERASWFGACLRSLSFLFLLSPTLLYSPFLLVRIVPHAHHLIFMYFLSPAGCFEESSPPDSYATDKNALFKSAGNLNDMGYWYGYTSHPDRRTPSSLSSSGASVVSRHHAIAERLAAAATREAEASEAVARESDLEVDTEGEKVEEEVEEEEAGLDCDEICELRAAGLAAWEIESAV